MKAPLALACCLFSSLGTAGEAAPGALSLTLRDRIESPGKGFEIRERAETWKPAETAVVICDMWDKHWCKGASERVAELAPAMNRAVAAARAKGVLIVHAPSECMSFYKDHPARKRALAAAKAANLPADMSAGCGQVDAERKGVYPIDQGDGGCDCSPQCPQGNPWRRQIAAIEIKDQDAISDNGAEIWNLFEQQGIKNVILMGVHTNMCVTGRSFGLRNMARHGKHVVLARDLTDTMYNSAQWPFVLHHRGTALIIEHIEKFICPTIGSSALGGGADFAFRPDSRKRVVFVIGEDEYKTWETLPAFAKSELEPQGMKCIFAMASDRDPTNFSGMEALADADLAVLSVRRRSPKADQLARFIAYLKSGKPLVGVRTACHAFDTKGKIAQGCADWPAFDPEVLGGHYTGHHANGAGPTVVAAEGAAQHALLAGVTLPIKSSGSLYKVSPLAKGTKAVLVGSIPGQPAEPVAWTNRYGESKVFYTSLGAPGDFAEPGFRSLLENAIRWAMAPPENDRAETEPAERKVANAPPPLAPGEALKVFSAPDDLVIETVLSEPEITQPVYIDFDEKGRLWVAEYRQYPFPAGLKMLSRDGVWRATYDRAPKPPPHDVAGADRITIHEDGDGDGTFEKHKTFIAGLNIATSFARGDGGVYVLNPPYLLHYPDKNNDDVPDADPEVLLEGFGLEDTHSVANSLRFGPDGWLYGAQGSTVTGAIKKPGDAAQPVRSQGQLIWRYEPASRRYEVFAEGGGNAFGLVFDSVGRVFSGHNGGDTRGFHYVQGGYYQKGFAKHGPLSNPFAFGYFPAMKSNPAPRFSHTFEIYEAAAFPEKYRGKLFAVEPLLNQVMLSELSPDGSTLKTKDLGPVVSSKDPWFRPVDIKLGPDGALYIADWYDAQVNHYRNHEGFIDKTRGRVYRLKAKSAPYAKPFDLSALSTRELTLLLTHKNRWHHRTIVRLLREREREIVERWAVFLLKHDTGAGQLDALWLLGALGGLSDERAVSLLRHPDPYVRAWTVQFLGDKNAVSSTVAEALAAAAARDPSPIVRSRLAASARRLAANDGLAIVRALATRAEDASDPHIPLLIWWAIEAKCMSDRAAVLALLRDPSFMNSPIVERVVLERLMRRFALAERPDLEACNEIIKRSPSAAATARLAAAFLSAPALATATTELPPELAKSVAESGGSVLVGLIRRNPEAIRSALEALADQGVKRETKLRYLEILAQIKLDSSAPLIELLKTTRDNDLIAGLITALGRQSDPPIADALIAIHPRLRSDLQAQVLSALASRRTWAQALLDAIEARKIGVDQAPAEILQTLRELSDPTLRERARKLLGEQASVSSAAAHDAIERLAGVIRAGKGTPKAGKAIFENRCARCHVLFGSGGKVGPDLTSHQRSDLDAMLLAVVNPGAEIREGYSARVIALADGRTLSGVAIEDTPRSLILRCADGKDRAINRDEIEEDRTSRSSLMPEGLLTGMSDQDVRDLFAYLRSTQPLID